MIPARGGSKRLPGKNIRDFAGQPMIAYSIQRAFLSGLFERVIVSTDDARIARVSRDFGADVPFERPKELAGDEGGTIPVIAHAINWLQTQGSAVSAICCIYATAPFMHQDYLKEGLAMLEAGPRPFVFAATTFAAPIFRSFQRRPDGGIEMFFPEHFNTRSQDLPEALHDAGQFYWGRPHAWLDTARNFGRDSGVVMVPRWRVQDIDTEEDWVRAEMMARHLGPIE